MPTLFPNVLVFCGRVTGEFLRQRKDVITEIALIGARPLLGILRVPRAKYARTDFVRWRAHLISGS